MWYVFGYFIFVAFTLIFDCFPRKKNYSYSFKIPRMYRTTVVPHAFQVFEHLKPSANSKSFHLKLVKCLHFSAAKSKSTRTRDLKSQSKSTGLKMTNPRMKIWGNCDKSHKYISIDSECVCYSYAFFQFFSLTVAFDEKRKRNPTFEFLQNNFQHIFCVLSFFSFCQKRSITINMYLRLMAYEESDYPKNHIRNETYRVYG